MLVHVVSIVTYLLLFVIVLVVLLFVAPPLSLKVFTTNAKAQEKP